MVRGDGTRALRRLNRDGDVQRSDACVEEKEEEEFVESGGEHHGREEAEAFERGEARKARFVGSVSINGTSTCFYTR